ncbi:peptidase domain-containing ABC transporter [Senegalia massiliensis]|uniref:Peptidase domain-containing ABC transporter n=1 Tax=Senegalia massiliensis TaxID=1720316 RepID=A0A845QW21_9CLOT|nr:peptidase domain-containing ABC transporter [Senegalia massiliensis]NBI06280.1 peptidase domain-containing ABC transporter [Senegalia massiliensis]
MFRKKYISIKQHDIQDCGAACLATISKTYGLNIPISKIREVAGTDMMGTNAYGMVKAAEDLGFSAKAVRGTPESLHTEFPLPAIAHVVIDNKLLHYIVIHKIDKKKKQITVADPAKGIEVLTEEEFNKIWTGVLIILVPTESFEKRNENEGVLRRFFELLKPQKKLLLNVFLASLIYTILGIVASFYFKFLMDDILPNNLRGTLNVISIAFLLLYIFQTILNAFRSHLLLYLSQRLDIPLILGYYKHVLQLPMNFFSTRKVGEIVSRFMDASKIRHAISGATLTIMIDTGMVFAGGIILFIQSRLLFGISLVIGLLYAIIALSFNKSYKKNQQDIMEENSQVTSYLVESLQGIETVKSFNSEDKSNLETEKRFVKLLKTAFHGGVLQNVQGNLKGIVQSVGGLVILWVGAIQVMDGNLTIGQLLTFNALLAYFLTPIRNLIDLQLSMQTAIVSAERLAEILDLEIEKDRKEHKKISPSKLSGEIEFNNVDFRYGTRELVLKDINLEIKQGERIALVGESGSGKTTLAKLILNFYKAQKGEILLDDYNILDINRDVLRQKIGYIPQNIFLFSGTVEENLRLGNQTASMEEIIEICKITTVHDFINEMPLRYNTTLDENGSNLSGGQRQRLALARALIKKPDILIMDEATSNLDSTTEKSIENLIKDNFQEMTMIIIAHRLSTIRSCDRIYVMDQGFIIEEGNHEELLKEKGKYYELWESQFPEKELSPGIS